MNLRAQTLGLIIITSLSLFAGAAFAQGVPVALNVTGELHQPGTFEAITNPSVNFRLEVWDKAGTCRLYSEEHVAENLKLTNGRFSVTLGGGSNKQNLIAGTGTLSAAVFANPGLTPAFTGCPAGVTLASGDERQLRIAYDLGGGYVQLSPDVPVVSSAYAVVAETLEGYHAADFLRVADNGSTALSQTNTEYAFSAVNWPRLKALLDGVSSQYLPTTPTAPLNFNNQKAINVADPVNPQDVVNKRYADGNLGGHPIDQTAVGPMTGNGSTLLWDATANKWVAGALNTSPTGSAGGDLTGTYPNPLVANNAITSAKIKNTGIAVNRLIMTDAVTGAALTYGECIVAGHVLSWTTTGWTCTAVSDLSPVRSVAGKTGDVLLNAADIGGLGTAAVRDYGTAAGQIPLLDAQAKMPPVDGSQLTGVNAVKLQTRDVANVAPVTGQVLGWNGSAWVPVLGSTGTVTSVDGRNGILGGPITTAGTLYLDTGTAASQIVQLNAAAQLPAVDGSQLTKVNAVQLQTRAVAVAAPTSGQVLGWNMGLSQWEPTFAAQGSVINIGSGTGLLGGPISQSGTLSVDVGTTASKILQLNATAQIPAVDGSLLTQVNAVKLQTRTIASTAPTAGQVLGWNITASQWEPVSGTAGAVTNIATANGILGGPITSTGTISVDTGTTASKILQLNASAQIPAVDGSLLFGVKLGTRTVATTAPSTGQVLGWNTTTSVWEPVSGTAGAVTNVASGTGLTGGPITSTGTLNVDVGTTASKILQLNASAQIPAVDGSLLTFVNAVKLQARTVAATQPNPGQVLGWNNVLSQWEPVSGTAGAVTNIATTNGILGGPITSTGTISIDTGTTASKILQLNASAQIPAVDGSLLTQVNAIKLQTRAIASTQPNAGQVLGWNNVLSQWEPVSGTAGAVTNIATGVGLLGGPITSTGTIVVDVGSAASKIVQENANAQIAQTLGTTAMPAYTFAGNENTGLYSPGANQLSFATSGTTSVNISPSGKVGVGTSNANSLLEVTRTQDSTNGIAVYNLGTGAGSSAALFVSSDVANGSLYSFSSTYAGNYGSISRAGRTFLRSAGASANGLVLDTGSTSPIILGTNDTERLRIDGLGNVGIGTASPLAGLDVATTGTTGSAIVIPRDTTANRPTGVNGMLRYNNTLNAMEGYINGVWSTLSSGSSAGTVTNIATATGLLGGPITTNGTLSVDVGSAASKIVQENANAQIAQTAGTVALPSYSFAGNTAAGLYSPATNQLGLVTNGTAAMTILANGNVGVGTTAPNSLFEVVNGKSSMTSLSGGYLGDLLTLANSSTGLVQDFGVGVTFKQGTVNTGTVGTAWSNNSDSANTYMRFDTRSAASVSEKMRITASGSLGIGTSAPAAILDAYGTGAASAIVIPRDTTANRPTGVNGMLRYNNTLNAMEGFINGVWSTLASGSTAGTVTNVAGGTGILGGPISTNGTLSVDVGSSASKIVQENSNAQIAQTLGTVGLPAYTFAGNENTGIYSPASNQLSFVANGSSALNVLANGNIGVGTGSPVAKLDVNGAVRTAQVLLTSANSVVGTLNPQNVSLYDFGGSGATNPSYISLRSGRVTGPVADGDIIAEMRFAANYNAYTPTDAAKIVAAASGTVSTTSMPSRLSFLTTPAGSTTAVEAVRIGPNGSVGIGTITPQALLDLYAVGSTSAIIIPRDTASNRPTGVNGMLRYNTDIAKFEGYAGGTWATIAAGSAAGTVTNVATSTGLLGGPITTNGTLSVDVGSAANKVVQENANAQIAQATGTSSLPSYSFYANTNTGMYSPGTNQVALVSNGVAALNVGATGNVGVGSTTPVAKLDLNFGVISSAALSTGLAFNGDGTLFANTATASNGTAGEASLYRFAPVAFWSPNTAVTTTNAATLKVQGAPSASGGMSLTNASSLWVDTAGTNSVNGFGVNATSPFGATNGIGGRFTGYNLSSNPTTLSGLEAGIANNGGGTTASAYGLRVTSPVVAGGGAITSYYGVYIQPPTAAGTNYALYSEGGTNYFGGNVGIGTSTPLAALDVATLGTASAIIVPRDTTANRPTGVNGMLRYSTTLNAMEGYINGAWSVLSAGSAAGTVTNVAGGTGILGGPITTNGTLSVDVGSAANKIVQENVNAQIAQMLGTVALPSYTFAGNTNTGLYSPGANQLSLVTNGSSALTAVAGGYIGIGTTAPAFPLDVQVNSNAYTGINLTNLNTSGSSSADLRMTSDAITSFLRTYNAASGNLFQVQTNAALMDIRTTAANSDIQFAPSNASTVWIKGSGRVGIGTNNPLAALDVSLAGSSSALLVPRDTSGNRPTGVNGMLRYNTDVAQFEGYVGGTWATIAAGSAAGTVTNVATSTGLLGGPITTNGTLSVDVGSAANKIVQENNNAQIAQLLGTVALPSYTFSGNTNTGFYSPGANQVSLAINGTASLNVIASGNVGIGTSTPNAPLEVRGPSNVTEAIQIYRPTSTAFDSVGLSIYQNNASAARVKMGQIDSLILSNTAGAERAAMRFYVNSGNNVQEYMRFAGYGNVGIGTGSPVGGAVLDIYGTGPSLSTMVVPRDTTANRPGTGVNGMLRYNTSLNAMEGYINGAWATFSSGSSAGTVTNVAGGTGILGGPITTNGTLSVDVGSAASKIVQENSNAQIAQMLGTVALPSYTFAGNTNTGVYSPGTNQLALVSNGTAALTLAASGFVAIGTTNATDALTLAGDMSASGQIKASTSVYNSVLFANNQIDPYGLRINAQDSVNVDVDADNSGVGGFNLRKGSSNPSAATPLFTVTNAGNVGIGTSTSLVALDILATGSTSAIIVPRDTTANRPTGVNGMIRYSTSLNAIEGYINGAWSTLAAGSAAGTVTNVAGGTGILGGPITTNGTLSVDVGTGGNKVVQENANAQIAQAFGTVSVPSYSFAGNLNTGLYSPGTGRLALSTSGTAAFNVLANGFVGIGTDAPATPLEVNGNAKFNAGMTIASDVASGGKFLSADNSAATPTYSFVYSSDTGMFSAGAGSKVLGFSTAGIERARVDASGKVGVGTQSPQGILDLYATGSSSALVIPRDSTANRPTGVNGMLRYSTTLNAMEGYINGAWSTLASGSAAGTVTNVATSTGLLGGPITTNGTLTVDVGSAASKIVQENVNAQIAQMLGTVALPSYTFAGNTNTGFYSPAANQLALVTNGTAGLTLSAVGNLGIGTAATSSRVSINDPGTNGGVIPLLISANSGSGPGKYVNVAIDNQTSGAYKQGIEFRNNGSPKYSLNVDYQGNGSNNIGFLDNVAGAMRLLVDPNGSVGIGTGTPLAALDVAVTGSASAIIVPRDTTANRPTGVNGMLRYSTSLNALEGYINGAWSTLASGSSAGTVTNVAGGTGILGGPITTNGTLSVDVGSAANKIVQENNNAQIAQMLGTVALPSYTFAGNTNTGLFSPGANQLSLATNGASVLTAIANGNVGIGTATPTTLLTVGGQFSPGVTDVLQLGSTFTGSGTNVAIKWGPTNTRIQNNYSGYTGGYYSGLNFITDNNGTATTAMAIGGNGYVGIGTTTALSALDVNVTGSGSAIIVPRDTTANRPTGVNGMLRYSTTLNAMEGYINGAWSTLSSGSAAGTVTNVAGGTGILGGPITSNGTLSVDVGTGASKIVQENANAQIAQGSGTVALPSYAFAGNANTGFYSPGTNQLSLVTNGTASLNVLASGFVGIGTNVAPEALSVNGSVNIPYGYYLKSNGAGFANSTMFGTYYNGTADVLTVQPAGNSLSQISFNTATTSASAATAKMVIYPNGFVGVGSSNPQSILDVAATGSGSAMIVPRDTTANRPTGVNGMLRYSTTLNAMEGFINGTWATLASGTSSSSLVNFIEAVNTTAPNATVPVVSLTANNAASSVDVTLAAKGDGGLAAQLADNGTTGGNKRGLRAVDWQMARGAAAAVASGAYSVIAGGLGNRATGQADAVLGGLNNTASGAPSAVVGGSLNTASGSYSLAGGYSSTASGYMSTAIGYLNTAGGQYSLAHGAVVSAPAMYQTTFGSFNAAKGSENASAWIATDPLLVVGNGTSSAVTSNAMMILKNGNVGLGTNAPAATLDVNGGVAAATTYEGVDASYANSGTAFTIPDANTAIRRVTLTGNATITLPAYTAPTGKMYSMTVFLKQDGTGGRTVAFAGSGSDVVKWDSNVAPTISSTAGKITIIQLMKPADEAVWYGSMVWKEN